MAPVVPIQGSHILLDIYDGCSERLNDEKFVLETLVKAAKAAGATVLKSDYVKFPIEGVTAFCILSESHISCHTWPTQGFATFDVYTCGKTDVMMAVPIILEAFKISNYTCKNNTRGVI